MLFSEETTKFMATLSEVHPEGFIRREAPVSSY